MGGRLVALAVALVLAVPAVAAAAEPVSVNWTALLPPLPSPNGNTGGPQPFCKKATIRCIDTEIRRMRRLKRSLGCDHRGVFDTTYLELTRELRRTLVANHQFFADRRALIYEDALFAQVYFNTVKAEAAGKPVDDAWAIAFHAARDEDVTGAGDMLLGINAHVQNDMPFVLAALTLRDAKGRSRKDDHDRFNEVLNAAFEGVVREIARRFDPLAALETYQLSPATDVFGIELVRLWREGVWRNAERLVNAKSDAERKQVADSIHLQAAASARLIEGTQQGPPGYRAQRDAYCATGPSGGGSGS
jgi:hypothetical protein